MQGTLVHLSTFNRNGRGRSTALAFRTVELRLVEEGDARWRQPLAAPEMDQLRLF
jgi:hypothetical protein